MSKGKFLRLAGALLVFMSLIGWVVIDFIQRGSLIELLLGRTPWYYQVVLGTIYGLISALAGWQIVKLPQLREIKNFFTEAIGGLELNQF
jgi:hypothetical protein